METVWLLCTQSGAFLLSLCKPMSHDSCLTNRIAKHEAPKSPANLKNWIVMLAQHPLLPEAKVSPPLSLARWFGRWPLPALAIV